MLRPRRPWAAGGGRCPGVRGRRTEVAAPAAVGAAWRSWPTEELTLAYLTRRLPKDAAAVHGSVVSAVAVACSLLTTSPERRIHNSVQMLVGSLLSPHSRRRRNKKSSGTGRSSEARWLHSTTASK